MVSCLRCGSLVVREVFVDYHADGGAMSFLGYRCLICGDIQDATILRHRVLPAEPVHPHTRRRRAPVAVGRRRSRTTTDSAGSWE